MYIDTYSFGRMTVKGQVYTSDIIIFPDKIQSDWWRKEGHSLALDDLPDVIAYKPEILVVGTGASGIMSVPARTRDALKKQNIELIDTKTSEAYRVFNSYIQEGKKVVGAFHLTC